MRRQREGKRIKRRGPGGEIARLALLGCWLPVLLSGCSLGQELDEIALVRVLSIDGSAPVTLTAVCDGTDQEDPSRGQCSGEDFLAALSILPWSGAGTQELSVTSVTDLVVGRDADLHAVLLAVLEDRQLGAASSVWLAEESAAAVLSMGEDPAGTLALLHRQKVQVPTAAAVLAELLSEGSAVLPVLGADEQEPMVLGEETVRLS